MVRYAIANTPYLANHLPRRVSRRIPGMADDGAKRRALSALRLLNYPPYGLFFRSEISNSYFCSIKERTALVIANEIAFLASKFTEFS